MSEKIEAMKEALGWFGFTEKLRMAGFTVNELKFGVSGSETEQRIREALRGIGLEESAIKLELGQYYRTRQGLKACVCFYDSSQGVGCGPDDLGLQYRGLIFDPSVDELAVGEDDGTAAGFACRIGAWDEDGCDRTGSGKTDLVCLWEEEGFPSVANERRLSEAMCILVRCLRDLIPDNNSLNRIIVQRGDQLAGIEFAFEHAFSLIGTKGGYHARLLEGFMNTVVRRRSDS